MASRERLRTVACLSRAVMPAAKLEAPSGIPIQLMLRMDGSILYLRRRNGSVRLAPKPVAIFSSQSADSILVVNRSDGGERPALMRLRQRVGQPLLLLGQQRQDVQRAFTCIHRRRSRLRCLLDLVTVR